MRRPGGYADNGKNNQTALLRPMLMVSVRSGDVSIRRKRVDKTRYALHTRSASPRRLAGRHGRAGHVYAVFRNRVITTCTMNCVRIM